MQVHDQVQALQIKRNGKKKHNVKLKKSQSNIYGRVLYFKEQMTRKFNCECLSISETEIRPHVRDGKYALLQSEDFIT